MRFTPTAADVIGLPQPLVILGSNGMLARAFCELIERNRAPSGLESPTTLFTRREVDLAQAASLSSLRAAKPRLVINCAAWTDVDGAEANEQAADAVNGVGVGRLAAACRELEATLVHFSTDYVFDGNANEPYRTEQARKPLNAYGRTKAHGEQEIEFEMARGLSVLVLRTSWLYAPWGKNFVRTIVNAARTRPSLRVVNDQRGRPTSSEHLARVTFAMLAKGARGIHHATDGGECTWFDFAAEIARTVKPACQVRPCTSDEFPRPAKRPGYSVLDLSPTEKLVGQMPDWRENLADVLGRLEP